MGAISFPERPSELPIQQPATFALIINLKTAKILGLTMVTARTRDRIIATKVDAAVP